MIVELAICAAGSLTVGFLVGFEVCYRASRKQYTALLDSSNALMDTLVAAYGDVKKAKYKKVKAKVGEVNKIMDAQLDLWGQVDGPNKGASHSRWKQDIISQINKLEEDKVSVFRSIVKDGMDLTVGVVMSDGTKLDRKMSEIVKEYDIKQLNKPQNTPTTKNENEPFVKLRLLKSQLQTKESNHDTKSK